MSSAAHETSRRSDCRQLPRVPFEHRLELVVRLRYASGDHGKNPKFEMKKRRDEASQVPHDLGRCLPGHGQGRRRRRSAERGAGRRGTTIRQDRRGCIAPTFHEDGVAGPGVVLAPYPNDHDIGQDSLRVLTGHSGEVWMGLDRCNM